MLQPFQPDIPQQRPYNKDQRPYNKDQRTYKKDYIILPWKILGFQKSLPSITDQIVFDGEFDGRFDADLSNFLSQKKKEKKLAEKISQVYLIIKSKRKIVR